MAPSSDEEGPSATGEFSMFMKSVNTVTEFIEL